MGQDTKYIITTETIKVPINIVHFKEGNSIVFPIMLDDFDFKDISEYSEKSDDNVYTFFDLVLASPYSLEYPIKNLFYFFRDNVKNLGIISFREILDLPHDLGTPILFIDNKIVDLTQEEDPEDRLYELLKSDISTHYITRQEDKYWSYEDSEIYYLENLNK